MLRQTALQYAAPKVENPLVGVIQFVPGLHEHFSEWPLPILIRNRQSQYARIGKSFALSMSFCSSLHLDSVRLPYLKGDPTPPLSTPQRTRWPTCVWLKICIQHLKKYHSVRSKKQEGYPNTGIFHVLRGHVSWKNIAQEGLFQNTAPLFGRTAESAWPSHNRVEISL